jgi:hypothetical protein
VLAPLAVGAAALVGLVVLEYVRADAVTPVRMLAHAFPVTGILIAMVTGAAAVSMLELAQELAVQGMHAKPLAAGLMFWPQVAAVIVASAIFGAAFNTKHITTLITAGTLVLATGAVGLALTGRTTDRATAHTAVMLVAATIGFGAGATVSPGLFLAGLSMPSSQLGPTFALVELLRSEAAFILGPILLHISLWHGRKPPALDHGVSVGAWIVLAVLLTGLAICAALWRASGARSHAPDLDRWLGEGQEGMDSPQLLASIR